MYFRVGAGGAGYEIYVTTSDTSLYGVTLTLSKSGTTVGTAVVDNQGKAKFTVKETGTYTITFTSQGTTYTETVEVSAYEVEIEAGFQFKSWLGLTDLDPDDYSSLAEVLADEKAVRQLMTVHASVDYLASFTADDTSVVAILNNDIAAKRITCTAYAEDTLSAAYGTLMESIGKYGYGKWVITDSTTTPPTWGALGNVPIMTSNNAPYGEASASSISASGRDAYHAFDGLGGSSTWWSSVSSSSSSWIQYKFVTPVKVSKIEFTWRGDTVAGTVMPQISNDGTNFTNLLTSAQNIGGVADQKVTVNVSAEKQDYALILRLAFTVNTSGASALCKNCQFYGRQMTVSVPKMTGNNAPYGEAEYISTSGVVNASHPIWHAFDGDDTTYANSSYNASTVIGSEYIYQYTFVEPFIVRFAYLYHQAWGSSATTFTNGAKLEVHDVDTNEWINIQDISYKVNVAERWVVDDINIRADKVRVYGTFISDGGGKISLAVNTLQFFGFDYSEKEWDTDHPRKYIYDNGVELETITTSGTVTKNPNCLTLASQNAQASVTLDTTSYNLLRAFVGQHASGTNTLICGAGTATFIAANMPYAQGLDVSNVNGDSATGVKQTSAGVFDCEAVWLE